jgi:hypothetical protein
MVTMEAVRSGGAVLWRCPDGDYLRQADVGGGLITVLFLKETAMSLRFPLILALRSGHFSLRTPRKSSWAPRSGNRSDMLWIAES